MDYYSSQYYRSCKGPCKRTSIDIRSYTTEGLREFDRNGLCAVCGGGALFETSTAVDRTRVLSKRKVGNAQSQPSLMHVMKRKKMDKKHPLLYKALSQAKNKKQKTLGHGIYVVQTRQTERVDEEEIDYEPVNDDDDEDEEPHAAEEAAPEPVPDADENETTVLGTETITTGAGYDSDTEGEGYGYDSECVSDGGSVSEQENLELNKKELEPWLHTEEHRKDLAVQGMGMCCFCGDGCNISSQACGACVRNGGGLAIILGKL